MIAFKETIYGKCPANWEISTLNDLSQVITDGSHFSPKPRSTGKYMCSVKDMTYNRFDFKDCKLISQTDYDKLVSQGCKPQKNDILISKDGANCLDLIFVHLQDEDLVLLSSIAIVRLLTKASPSFVRYFLLSPACQFILKNNFVTGSAIPRVVLKDFKKVEILLPPLPEQRAIASVLSSLDDKIDLLHCQNKTLEAMAETLFRQWFVEEAEQISEKKIALGDLIETVSITHIFPKSQIIFLNTSDIYLGDVLKHEYESVKDLPGQAKKSIRKDDILFSEIRPANGRYAYVDFYSDDYVVSTKLMVLRSKGIISQSFVYFYLTHPMTLEWLQTLAEGRSGTFPQITFDQLRDLAINVPSDQFLNSTSQSCELWLKKIKFNHSQIRTLENLRDSLLPKLISGEIQLR